MAACSGFVYALSVADQHIKSGMCKNVLVIGADALSKTCDPTDRSTISSYLVMAQAQLLLVRVKSQVFCLRTFTADGKYGELLSLEVPERGGDADKWLHMAGNEVFQGGSDSAF